MGQIGTDTGTAQLSTLLTQLNASNGAVLPPPSPAEAMAIYSVAVRLAELQLALTDSESVSTEDTQMTRDVLRGTRKMLRAALARVEPEPLAPRLVLIDGGAPA